VLDAWLWARAARGEVAVPESRRWIEGYERIGEQGERRPALSPKRCSYSG
jgi:hypothetical protein